MSRRAWLFLVAALAACRPASTPPPSTPPSTAPSGGLRPLTSRDPGAASDQTEAPAAPARSAPDAPSAAAANGASVSGIVSVAPSLASRVQPTDVLYLIARNARTGGVVAVRREEAVRFPFAFGLGPGDVMVQGTTFEGPFDVTARLSKSGDAVAAKGDLEGGARGVAAGARAVAITLERVRE
jgi:cytochrome c-type biogenesis protein CcmH